MAENKAVSRGDRLGTALITGASSGIGEAFARRLAADGYDLILTARREERLCALAEELERANGIEAEPFAADLSKTADVDRLVERIQAAGDLEILVNNAGFGAGGRFHKIDFSKQLDMIQVHVVAVARLTRAALPKMVKRRSGGIINVSSVAGFASMPRSTMYCSTKAWLISFSRALAMEMAGKGVRIQALCPGFTYTEFHDTPEYADFDRSMAPKWLWMTSDQVIEASLRDLKRGRAVCVPGFKNRLLLALVRGPLGWLLTLRFARKRWKDV